MLKGLNRNVLVVRADRKSRFEAVYFVMKKGSMTEKGDMLKEANRIINDSGMALGGRDKGKIQRAMLYGAFAFLGALVASVMWIAVLLII